MPIAPATLTNPPTSPDRSDPTTFSARAVALDDFTKNVHVPEMQASITNVYNNAVESNTSAVNSAASAVSAVAAANFKGNWSALTGALNMPASVAHNGNFWALNTNLANVTTATPGVSASWTFLNVGAGGALESTSAVDITLTNLSFKVQAVTMTAADKSVTLPSATGLPAGGELFVIKNSGSIAFAVRSNGGKMLTQLDGGQTAMLYLANVSTAAGVWVVGHVNDVAITQTLFQATATTINAVASGVLAVTKISATQAVAAWSTGTGLVAVTLNLSGNSVSAGAAVAVTAVASPTSVAVTSLSATQAVVVTTGAAGALIACTLNISGTALTAGAILTVNASACSLMSISSVSGTQAVASYVVATIPNVVCLTVSGTTLTAGATLALGGSAAQSTSIVSISATKLVVAYRAATAVTCNVALLTGTTLSLLSTGTVHGFNSYAAIGNVVLAKQSPTECLLGVLVAKAAHVRTLLITASDTIEAGSPKVLHRATDTNTNLSLTNLKYGYFCLLDSIETYLNGQIRQPSQAQVISVKNNTVDSGPPSRIKNSEYISLSSFADIVALSEALILAVYLEPSGFVQARVLEVAA